VLAQLVCGQHVFLAPTVWIEAVLHHAAIPGACDLFVRINAALREMIRHERSEVVGAIPRRMDAHEHS
jgi:hypothetical protein